MDRNLRWLVAALVLATAPSARAEPDAQRAPRSSPEDIEVFRGSQRSVDRGSLHDASLQEEHGVLGIRGTRTGATRVDPDALATLGGPAREQLRAELEAIGRIYTEVLGLSAAPELAEQLSALEPGETLRARQRHARAPSRTSLTPGQELAERTRHAASHAWVHALAPDAPPWLDEGLACYLESIERLRDGGIRVRANTRRHDALRSRARSSELPGLKTLLGLPFPAVTADPAAAASWALTFSLMGRPDGREGLRALLRGARPPAVASRLAELRVGDPSSLPRTWQRTTSGDLAPHLLIPGRPAPALDADETATTAPSEERPYEPRRRRALRCVRGVIGPGTPDARPALFCSRPRTRARER